MSYSFVAIALALEPCAGPCSYIHLDVAQENYGERLCLFTLFPELCIPNHWPADYSPVLLQTLTYEKNNLDLVSFSISWRLSLLASLPQWPHSAHSY